MLKKAVIYSRVSTTRQAEEGISLDAQLAQARSWCEAMNYEIIGECSDNGVSGRKVTNRPGLQEALELACQNQAALLVYSLSRLARSTKDLLAISERLEATGADMVSLSESIDTTSAAGKMIFRMLAVLAEFERDLTSERTKTALAHKRAQGFKTGGTVPYGYDVQDKKLVPNAEEQKVITYIRSLRHAGHSLRAIARTLNQAGIKSKTGNGWKPQTIKDILERKDNE